jgi:hypothetical protein
MLAHHALPAATRVVLLLSDLLAIAIIAALLWLGLPWLVLALILAAPALILTLT